MPVGRGSSYYAQPIPLSAVDSSTALVWDRLNTFFFLAGDSTEHELNQELNNLIIDTIFPEVIQLQYRKFFLQFTPQTWEERISVLLKGSNPQPTVDLSLHA